MTEHPPTDAIEVIDEVAKRTTQHGSIRSARRGEALVFWSLVAAQLIPIWGFQYLPTQDGPAHLSNAVILREYRAPGTHYHELFEIRREPIPNWTAHLMLAGLMFIVSPLVAEKLLVTGYVLGLAGAMRYYCGAFGEPTKPLALVGLLFTFNRCFWLGFYNFGLSLALCFFMLGYWLRHREQVNVVTSSVFSLLLTATFFTHLAGFLLAATALSWLALASPRRRGRNLAWVILACLPASLLAWDYLVQTGFFGAGGSERLFDHAAACLRGFKSWHFLGQELIAMDSELFAHHSGERLPLGLIVLGLYAVLVVGTLLSGRSRNDIQSQAPSRWPIAGLAFAFLLAYVVLPQHLNIEHGGFLKTRIVLLPPLLLLACLREPGRVERQIGASCRPSRLPILYTLAVRAVVVVILLINVLLVTQRVAADNRALAEYTAAQEVVGSGRVLLALRSPQHPPENRSEQLADPLLHAANYYCLGTGNLNADNYQAGTKHFPVHFRHGLTRASDVFLTEDGQDAVEVIISWEIEGRRDLPKSFESVFRQGRLEVFAKPSN
jgi:hypothetical protein